MASVSQLHLAVMLRSAVRPRRTGHRWRIGPVWLMPVAARHAAISKEPLSCDCFSTPPLAPRLVDSHAVYFLDRLASRSCSYTAMITGSFVSCNTVEQNNGKMYKGFYRNLPERRVLFRLFSPQVYFCASTLALFLLRWSFRSLINDLVTCKTKHKAG